VSICGYPWLKCFVLLGRLCGYFNFALRPPTKRIPPLGAGKRSSRQRVLAQWRGVDLAPLEKARAVPARTVAEVLPKLMKEMRMEARQGEAEVVKVWNELLDPNITAHAQPNNLHKGTLFVNVDSSVWLSEIVRYRRKEILDRLQHSFGKNLIQKISFRIG
jgi:predicted nucleic acid-binding Zn ribbon protein